MVAYLQQIAEKAVRANEQHGAAQRSVAIYYPYFDARDDPEYFGREFMQ
jgi:hypothetical protein